jgi:glycerate-2-kinase
MFDAAISAAQPALCLPPHLPKQPAGRLIVIDAGKASAAMAKAVEDNWPGELSGLVVTRYGYAVPCERIEIIESAHPVPDAASVTAARRILDTVRNLRADDVVLCSISGGGSSLLVAPLEGLTLDDKQLDAHPGIHALAGDTDGVDGLEEIAGAYIGPDTLDRAWARGIKPKESLADNDGHGLFQALGDSVLTGPTLTNVNDFRAVLIAADAKE